MSTTAVIAASMMAVAILLVVYGITSGDAEDEVTRRLNRYGSSAPTSEPVVRPPVNGPRDLLNAFTNAMSPLVNRSDKGGRLAENLARADLRMKPSEWVLAIVVVSAVLGTLLALRFSSVIPFVVAPVAVYFGSGFLLRFKQARRSRAFDRQLGETIILLSNALKAGYSFAQALSMVSKNAHPPIADEFARATREIALGINVDDALNHMVERNKSEDFDLLVTAVQIQRVVGGNLAEILDTIAFTIRERVRIKGEIRTLTAQARASGVIILLLPIGLAGLLSVISPSYFGPMLHETLGQVMLGIGIFMMAIGTAVIQKIVKIEV